MTTSNQQCCQQYRKNNYKRHLVAVPMPKNTLPTTRWQQHHHHSNPYHRPHEEDQYSSSTSSNRPTTTRPIGDHNSSFFRRRHFPLWLTVPITSSRYDVVVFLTPTLAPRPNTDGCSIAIGGTKRFLTSSSSSTQQHLTEHHNHNNNNNNTIDKSTNNKNDNFDNDIHRTSIRTSSSDRTSSSFDTSSSSTTTSSLLQLLSDNERQLFNEQKRLIHQSREMAQKVGISSSITTTSSLLVQSSSSSVLDDLSTFSIVVAGEFNAGKSSLINALLGQPLLSTGSIPTTDTVTIITSSTLDGSSGSSTSTSTSSSDGTSNSSSSSSSDIPSSLSLSSNNTSIGPNNNSTNMMVQYHTISNCPLLQDLTFVDTPGTNAIWVDHTTKTLQLLPNADLILFCTSADRPFPASEKQLLQSIAIYRKNIIVILTKMDILDHTGGYYGQNEKQQVIDYVLDQVRDLLGAQPILIPISARDALAAKLMKNSASSSSTGPLDSTTSSTTGYYGLWQRSNFGTLEQYLQQSLTKETKIKSKLINPLSVVDGLIQLCIQHIHDQQQMLQGDRATWNMIQSQFHGWHNELETFMNQARNEFNDRLIVEGKRVSILMARMSTWDMYHYALWDQSDNIRNNNYSLGKNNNSRINSNRSFLQLWDQTQPYPSNPHGIMGDLIAMADETADSVATIGRAQGQAVIEFLGTRVTATTSSSPYSATMNRSTSASIPNPSLIGSVTAASRFEETRRSLRERIGHALEVHVMDGNLTTNIKTATTSTSQTSRRSTITGQSDMRSLSSPQGDDNESILILSTLRRYVYMSSSLYLGGIVTATTILLAPSTATLWGSSPWVSAGIIAFLCTSSGMAVTTIGRQCLAKHHEQNWNSKKDQLDATLSTIFRKELDRVDRRVQEGVAPYARFIQTEHDRLNRLMLACENISTTSQRLRNQIKQLR